MDERKISDKISDCVTQFVGSWKFIIIVIVLLISWVLMNTLYFLDIISFDRYPFILLNLILSLIAAFQAPFILMSQNRQEKKQDKSYRMLFHELKELLEQDLETENEIKELHADMKRELKIVKDKQDRLYKSLSELIRLERITQEDIAEIFEEVRDED